MTQISNKQSINTTIKDILRRLRAVETSARLGNASITQGNLIIKGDANGNGSLIIENGGDVFINDQGNVTIDGGILKIINSGTFLMHDNDTNRDLFFVGAFTDPSLNKPNGNRQQGFMMWRDSGDLAFALYDPLPLVSGYHQFWSFWDRDGNIVLSDDTTSGFGLSSPGISVAMPINSDPTTWPSTTAGSFTTIAYSGFSISHPKLRLGLVYAAVGGNADFRILLDTTAVSSIFSIGSGGFGQQDITVDLTDNLIYDFKQLVIQARITSGSGTAYASLWYATQQGT